MKEEKKIILTSNKTKIQLIDRNQDMCDQWKNHFKGCDDVLIHHGDFFSLKTDCVVSPANSFGYMDGGLDALITRKLGQQVQAKLQHQMKQAYVDVWEDKYTFPNSWREAQMRYQLLHSNNHRDLQF